ncbi:MAG: hypothetical protein ABI813_13385 [Bacteroidota bacterium]
MSPLLIVTIIVVVVLLLIGLISALTGDDAGSGSGKPGDAAGGGPAHDHSAGTENCPACQAAAKAVKKTVPQKCLVLFRPTAAWKGEYGIDWMREGDSGLVGDVDYINIIGAYGSVYATEAAAVFTVNKAKYASLKTGFFNPYTISWKKDAKGIPVDYMIAWLSLFPKDQCTGNNKKFEAKISLDVEIVANEPEVLRLVYNKDYFELDKQELTPKTVGKYKTDLTIKCIKEFSDDQEIKIVPYKTDDIDDTCGKIKIVKNDKANRYKANIVFVKVATMINGVAKMGSTGSEKDFLEKYLFQSLTSLNFKEETLDLKTDATFNSTCVLAEDPSVNAVLNFLPGGKQVHGYLETKFAAAVPGYDAWFKVFFFDEDGGYMNGGNYQGLNGCAKAIPSKSVVLYNGHNTSTTTHELLHAVGLYHTFDNSGQFTYKIGETENIMDYSHQSTYGSKNRIATWKWQWDALHSKFEKE